MKRFVSAFATGILTVTLFAAPALANEKHDGKDKGGEMMGGHGMDNAVRMEHHKLMKDTLEMMKQTMTILKGLKHEPTVEQQKSLDEMIGRIDGIIKRHEEMMMKKQDMKKEMKEKKESGGK
ncbi:hypothetical protein EPN18_03960 [bacterium]|nr:MAG: hypothetical protein EPN18_03960 [bacterium]